MASTRSRSRVIRRRGSVPWLAISSRFQPAPTPNSNRPPDRQSTLATSLAVMIGSRSITRQIPEPTRSRVVTVTAAVTATNRSKVRAYLRGSSRPPGQGDWRSAGMCVCSGKNRDSCPRSSASRAMSAGAMASWVGKIATPVSMHPSLGTERAGFPLLAEQGLDLRQRPDHHGSRRRYLPVQALPVEVGPDDLDRADARRHAARAVTGLVVHEDGGACGHPEPVERAPEYLRRRLGRTDLAR